jgi:hypothetical protein
VTDTAVITACLVLTAILLVMMFRKGGTKNGLFVVAAFFTLFSFGPVLNFLLGRDYYFGVINSLIAKACVGFTLAIAGLAFANWFRPQRTDFDFARLEARTRHRYEFLPIVFALVSLYAAVVVLYRLPSLLGASKLQALTMAGPGHRLYLFLAICLTSFFFVTRRTKLLRCLYAIHCVTFLVYSIGFRERDFLLIFLSVLLHREILHRRGRSIRLVVAGVASTLAATLLFSLRGGNGFNPTGILNQGLLLFVDTFIMKLIPSSLNYSHGATYLEAIQRLPPRFLYDSGNTTLSQWFVERYNPGGTTGYGFSMTGEAYMNFGLLGIFVVFLLVALFHRYLINRLDRSDWFAYGSIYFTSTWMYAIRGDSVQFLKTMLYGAVVFLIFRTFSRRGDSPALSDSDSQSSNTSARDFSPGSSRTKSARLRTRRTAPHRARAASLRLPDADLPAKAR